VNIPENSRLIAHTQPGTGAAAVRASVADEAALVRLNQRSFVIINDAGDAATRFRPTAKGSQLARAEAGDVRLHAPDDALSGLLPGVRETAKKTGLSESKIQEILNTQKPNRPSPDTYLSEAAITKHLAPFHEGAVRIQPFAQTGQIGRTETWVFPKSFVDDAVQKASGDPRKLEPLLGLENGYLGSNPIRMDIPNPSNVRLPDGNEFGANDFWRPGGYTWPGGLPEAVIDPVPVGKYTSSDVFGK
jgi:hypothetical protein